MIASRGGKKFLPPLLAFWDLLTLPTFYKKYQEIY